MPPLGSILGMIKESYRLRGRLPSALQHHFFLFATTMGSVLGTLGHWSGPRAYFSPKPASVPLRQPATSETTSLRVLLETYCPSLFSPFRPSRWLFKQVHTNFFPGKFSRDTVDICRLSMPSLAISPQWTRLLMIGVYCRFLTDRGTDDNM